MEVRRIWDRAPHNAFTDLVHWNGRWWCVFREGQAHVSPDGALRIITSEDGEDWESAALLTSDTEDLRDAKIAVTPDGRLMLGGAGSAHGCEPRHLQSYVWYSDDGRAWDDPVPVGDPTYWVWRMTWHGDACYGFGYGCGPTRGLRLYRSTDGRDFETWVADLGIPGYPNETSMVFLADGTALCLLRRDGSPDLPDDPSHGFLGRAAAPYTDWTWQDVGAKIGGPILLELPGQRLLACVRLYDGGARSSLCWIDGESGKLEEWQRLPSGGDTSYAGMVWHEGAVYVSYYSSHEEKTAIYLARLEAAEID